VLAQVGSLNGGEVSAKLNREMALKVGRMRHTAIWLKFSGMIGMGHREGRRPDKEEHNSEMRERNRLGKRRDLSHPASKGTNVPCENNQPSAVVY